MKKKAALLLAILALGAMMVACGQSETSEPAPTATPTATPEATEAPAEPTETPEEEETDILKETPPTEEEWVAMVVEDYGLTQEEAEQLVREAIEWDTAENAEFEAEEAAHDEESVREFMEKFGLSEEEARAYVNQARVLGTASRIERGIRNRAVDIVDHRRIEAEQQAAYEQASKEVMDKFGLTLEQWQSMTPQEQYQWAYEHQQE